MKPKYKDSEFSYHTSCSCGSSDGRAVFTDGHSFCYVCNTYFASDIALESEEVDVQYKEQKGHGFISGEVKALTKRCITKATCDKFKYEIGQLDGKPVHIANYYDNKGNVILQKIRFPNKDFRIFGDIKKANYPLYGIHLWRETGRKIVITEGELDCMTVSQIQGNKYPVVSISNGINAAVKCIKANIKLLEKFDEVIFMFDMDNPNPDGKSPLEIAHECAALLSYGKGKIATLPLKDPNEMLMAGRVEEVIDAIWGAKTYRPDDIVEGEGIWKHILSYETKGIPFPFTQQLNFKTGGMRDSEIILLTAGTGSGKSLFAREIAYYLREQCNEPVGYIALEESVGRTAVNFLGFKVGKCLHVNKALADKEELRKAFEELFLNKPFYLINHFGFTEMENIISKIRELVKGMDCKFIFLDHISICVSGSGERDERKYIDLLMTELRTLTQELGCKLITIAHVVKDGFEEGKPISLKDLRGSGALAQLSDTIISLERNQQAETEEERNTSLVRVLKCRITGDTGKAGKVHYDADTGRLTEVFETIEPSDTMFDEDEIEEE
jgi:twinkle protein